MASPSAVRAVLVCGANGSAYPGCGRIMPGRRRSRGEPAATPEPSLAWLAEVARRDALS